MTSDLLRRHSCPVQLVAVAALALVAVIAVPASAAEKLPTLKLAELAGGDVPGWGDAGDVDGVRCRTAVKGRSRLVHLAAWWSADSLRPPEGNIYALEIRYRDTATTPVIASSYGGIGRYGSPREVHRFGGVGDNKWKTAVVCVGWDQLIRMPDKRSHTAVGLQANADLPVATIKVRPATPADRVRHDAETRAWIATVQAAKRKATPIKIAPRAFGKGKKLGAVVGFAWSSMIPLLPNAQPKDEQLGAPVKVRMCLNELEGGSFGVYANGKDLTGVKYAVSDLTGPGGKLVADVIPRTAEYALIKGGKKLKWYPQRLWPAFAVDIPAGRSHWFVFNLRTHRGKTKAGTYKGKVTITSDQGK
ncbi:hypothetical protein LCGC14_1484220, partial [marine sediment metagenome]